MYHIRKFMLRVLVFVGFRLQIYATELAIKVIRSHKSEHSLTTGLIMADPFNSPSLFTNIPALSSSSPL